jgi:hypothetical protein
MQVKAPHSISEENRTMTTATNPHPNVPLPAGAEGANDWESPKQTGHQMPSRYFTGTIRPVGGPGNSLDGIQVVIAGTQFADGTVNR